MEIIASELKEVLNRLSGILTNKGIVDNSDRFIFKEDVVYAFDGETLIQSKFETGVRGAVEGQSFLKYLDKMANSKIELVQNENCIDVKKGRSVASFKTEVENELPIEINNEIDWKKCPANLLEAMTACSYTCGHDYTDMRTVVVHVKGDVAESTDEERITRYSLKKKVKDEFFVPVDLINHLSRFGIVNYALSSDWLWFKNQNDDIICHRNISFGQEYPDLEQIVQQCQEGKTINFPDKMYDAVEKAAIFQSDLKIESDRKIVIRCKSNKIKVESHGTHGDYCEVLNTDLDKSFSFAINPSFLMQIMEKSDSIFFHPDYIRIETDNYVFLTTLAAE